jgi:phosphomannomutase
VIGKDTRRSSYMLEYSIVAGITASGADAYMLHVITTPGVSYVTRTEEFDCGIMITASHNPYHDNGIKIINKYGELLKKDGIMIFEIGFEQADQLRELSDRAGYRCEVFKDLGGNDRVCVIRMI